MTDEKVLAISRPAIEPFLRQGFFVPEDGRLMGAISDSAVFLDRKLAEEDPTHKQIIPYLLVRHQGRVLLYRRTPKQGENRLHNKFSLGFGGHINDIDGNKGTPTNLVWAAMIRELNEELFVSSVRQVGVVGFINDDSNAVGRVHLGVAFVVEAASDRFSVNEPDKIEAYWADAKAVEEIFPHLESWSQLFWTRLNSGAPQASGS